MKVLYEETIGGVRYRLHDDGYVVATEVGGKGFIVLLHDGSRVGLPFREDIYEAAESFRVRNWDRVRPLAENEQRLPNGKIRRWEWRDDEFGSQVDCDHLFNPLSSWRGLEDQVSREIFTFGLAYARKHCPPHLAVRDDGTIYRMAEGEARDQWGAVRCCNYWSFIKDLDRHTFAPGQRERVEAWRAKQAKGEETGQFTQFLAVELGSASERIRELEEKLAGEEALFSTMLSDFIGALGISDDELAKEFSLSRPTVDRWRSGQAATLPALRKHVLAYLRKVVTEKLEIAEATAVAERDAAVTIGREREAARARVRELEEGLSASEKRLRNLADTVELAELPLQERLRAVEGERESALSEARGLKRENAILRESLSAALERETAVRERLLNIVPFMASGENQLGAIAESVQEMLARVEESRDAHVRRVAELSTEIGEFETKLGRVTHERDTALGRVRELEETTSKYDNALTADDLGDGSYRSADGTTYYRADHPRVLREDEFRADRGDVWKALRATVDESHSPTVETSKWNLFPWAAGLSTATRDFLRAYWKANYQFAPGDYLDEEAGVVRRREPEPEAKKPEPFFTDSDGDVWEFIKFRQGWCAILDKRPNAFLAYSVHEDGPVSDALRAYVASVGEGNRSTPPVETVPDLQPPEPISNARKNELLADTARRCLADVREVISKGGPDLEGAAE